MSRPDKDVSWCDDDDPLKVVEPSSTKKLQGWIYKERPAFQFWNWVQRNFVKWILHLDVSVNHFDPHEAATPDMTVILSAGKVQNGITLTSVAEQTTAAFTAPSGNPRIDRIVVDNVTGVYSVIPGSEAASPVAPALTAGKISICQVLLDDDPVTTEITNDLITDERALFNDVSALIYDSGIIDTAVTTIDIPGLNLGLTESYNIVYSIFNPYAGDVGYYLTANGLNTLTDYYSQSIRADGATVASVRNNLPRFAGVLAVETVNGKGVVMLGNDNSYSVVTKNARAVDSTISLEDFAVAKTVALAGDVTSLRITSEFANAIGIGSRFRIYRTL